MAVEGRAIQAPLYGTVPALLWVHRTCMDGIDGALLWLPELYAVEYGELFPQLYYALVGTCHVHRVEGIQSNQMATAP